MAQLLFQNFSQSTTVVAPVTTAETVIIVSNPIAVPSGANFALVSAFLAVQFGTGTTGVTFRVRRGSTTAGALVGTTGNLTSGITASAFFADGVQMVDSPPPQDEAQYCLTMQQAGATGNAATSLESIAVFLF